MMKLDFLEGMAQLAAVYEKELPEPTLEAYWRILQDLTIEDWSLALELCGRFEKHWPSPAKILDRLDKAERVRPSGSWDEIAAGSGGTDPGRPQRIGEACARAWMEGDVVKSDYFQSLIDHMSEKEQKQATMARDTLLNKNQPTEADGNLRGYERFRAEATRLGLADIVPKQDAARGER